MRRSLGSGVALVMVAGSLLRPAEVGSAVGARLEGGLSVSTAADLSTFGPIVSAGVSVPLRGAARGAFGFDATSGDSYGGRVPEGPLPGRRSLTTFLLGIEAARPGSTRGPFVFLGLGVGHSTLSGARGSFRDFPDNRVPPRNDLGPAVGGALGYRTGAGPGPLGFQLALRAHGMRAAGQSVTHAIALTIGLVY